jgi:hypothetical protein
VSTASCGFRGWWVGGDLQCEKSEIRGTYFNYHTRFLRGWSTCILSLCLPTGGGSEMSISESFSFFDFWGTMAPDPFGAVIKPTLLSHISGSSPSYTKRRPSRRRSESICKLPQGLLGSYFWTTSNALLRHQPRGTLQPSPPARSCQSIRGKRNH